MSDFKLKFKLKQHTPIIHFQSFLPNATSRSTELISALDKFIIGENFSCWSTDRQKRLKIVTETNNEEKKVFKNWLKHAKEPKQPAFDYDIEIIYPDRSDKTIIDVKELKNDGFFGNQPNETSFEDKEIYKIGVFESNLITLLIKSPYPELLKEIDKIIAKFFLLKNFGTRQSKGFGNFFPIEKYNFLYSQSFLPYYFDYDKDEMELSKNRTYSLFQIINMFYNTLRSGLNHGIYFKSLMWAYAKKNNEHWDKKTIKNRYLNFRVRNGEYKKWGTNVDYPLGFEDKNNEHHLWRDLLGLSSNENAGSWKLKKEHPKKEITRFKSPIIFKPFQTEENKYRVFFGVDPAIIEQFKKGRKENTEAELLGETFNIKYKNSGNLELKYPKTFDYDAFLKFAIEKYNDDWIDEKFHDRNEFKIIDGIYSQLKKQIKDEE